MSSPHAELDTRGGSALTFLRFTLVLVALAGLVYPVVTTLLGGALFPRQANGSLLERGGRVMGSRLVGQPFSGARYFIGRPSAAGAGGYDPMSASGSNLAASNPALRARVQATAAAIAAREGVRAEQVPLDLLAASGSGLDPHISPASAALQVPRVARARGVSDAVVRAAVARHTRGAVLGVGEPRVNVLELNLELDGGR
ncbi:potassium-transporting ATPase subunit KdpC [Deinococcus maricopensis]|uniref:Potassium-transporting ATPase KdpC subunit n=1 Tax=Deinococcus maricopensis (strain DSM 21211 / LMG 22137 / NRRL B-23946 / LB-34) TaxID=709986 RepID=E8U853_DEIML|nr:potassium-transporting ATPase subunit KdpC [Deinococcus maricopensis]ADV67242.1 Potassium-transporting ATPase C chain [Deinococcus maricopensis DSM 21211]